MGVVWFCVFASSSLRAASHMRLRARDHRYTSKALSLLETAEVVQVRCFPQLLEGPTE